MASDGIDAQWSGLPDLKRELAQLAPKLRRRALRNALAAGARLVRDAAKAEVPVLQQPTRYRAKGTVRDAIKVRTSKQARAEGNVGVFVNVKPAKGAARGAKKPTDPFYWRWLNWGRQGRPGQPERVVFGRANRLGIKAVKVRRARPGVGPLPALRFLEKGAERLGDALRVITARLGPAVQRILDRQAQE